MPLLIPEQAELTVTVKVWLSPVTWETRKSPFGATDATGMTCRTALTAAAVVSVNQLSSWSRKTTYGYGHARNRKSTAARIRTRARTPKVSDMAPATKSGSESRSSRCSQ